MYLACLAASYQSSKKVFVLTITWTFQKNQREKCRLLFSARQQGKRSR